MKKFFTCFVALLAIAAAATGPARGQNSNVSWVLTPYGDLQDGDTVVIVDKTSARALPNNNGNLAPSAVEIDLSGDQNALSDAPDATLQWVVVLDGGNYHFRKPGTDLEYLYCSNTNNGVRVGTNSANQFTFENGGDNNVPFLKNTDNNRYIGVYNNQDWRCYTTINTNIKGCITGFYKRTVSSGGGSTPEPEPEPEPAPAVPHTVRFASGNDGWTVQDVTASSSATAPAVLENVMAGDSLVVTYSGTRKVKSVKAVKYVDPMTLPLTMEALNNGTITVQNARSGMKYSVNGGSKESTTRNTNINVSAGDKVQFYGNGTSITNYFGTNIKGSEGFTCKVYGNIMSLIDEENYATATTLANQAFANLFQNNTSLVDASNLMLPATTLAQQCYSGMFYGCSSLTAAPALPATTLKSGCYSLMFYGCSALIAAPVLPATTLDQYCYSGMFQGCSALIAAPALPATTLADNCYNGMFFGCSALIAAPALPATTLAQQCYYNMFQGCTSLTAAPVLPATTLATECYGSMFAGDTNLTSAPALPATTLANECYYNMFYGCSGLTAAPALPATTLADYCYASMFENCTGLTAAPALPATTLKSGCYSGMFYGCTGLTAAPALPATTLANNCYNNMFNGCSMLSSVTCLATDISASYCTDNWLTGVAATGTFITPSSTNWSTGASTDWPYGYNGIPDGWTRVNADE